MDVYREVNNGSEWVGVGEAGRILGVSRQRVYQLMKCGRLASKIHAGRVVLSRRLLGKYLEFTAARAGLADRAGFARRRKGGESGY